MSAKNENNGNVMTREQRLYSMRMVDLAEVAEKLGVKIDKKGKKSTAVLKILKAEESVSGDGTPLAEVGKEIAQQAKAKANDTKKVKPTTSKDNDGSAESDKKKDTKKKAVKSAEPVQRKKKEVPSNIQDVLDYLEIVAKKSGIEKFRYPNKDNIDQYRVDGQRVFVAIFSRNRILIECKSKYVNDSNFANNFNANKNKAYGFDRKIIVTELDAKLKKIIDSMVKQTITNIKTSKKEEN